MLFKKIGITSHSISSLTQQQNSSLYGTLLAKGLMENVVFLICKVGLKDHGR